MGIQVECPHGHTFKVKDKYAGKKGLCPHCEGQVVVSVPDAVSSEANDSAYRKAVADEIRASQSAAAQAASVLDDSIHDESNSSLSLMSSSVIRHNIKCSCGQAVPMWFARCPGCGKFIQQR